MPVVWALLWVDDRGGGSGRFRGWVEKGLTGGCIVCLQDVKGGVCGR